MMISGLKKSILIVFTIVALAPYAYSEELPGAQPASRPKAVKIKPPLHPEKEKGPKKIKYSYDPAGKKDPFQPYIAYVQRNERIGKAEDVVEVPLTELQKYELSQLKLVAVMDFAGKGVAMVVAPDGKGHTLYVGTLIGKNKGKVVEIKTGKVSIEEKYRDIMGEIKSTIQELVIKTSEGGK